MNPNYNNQMPNSYNGNPQMVEMREIPKAKTFNKKIIFIIVAIVLIIVTVIVLIKINNYPLYGNWLCVSGIDSYPDSDTTFAEKADIKIDMQKNQSFEMYDSKDKTIIDINGNFLIKEITEENQYTKYLIDMTTTSRIINGEKNTNKYATQYEITFDNNSLDEFVMVNTISYSMYYCKKVK